MASIVGIMYNKIEFISYSGEVELNHLCFKQSIHCIEISVTDLKCSILMLNTIDIND